MQTAVHGDGRSNGVKRRCGTQRRCTTRSGAHNLSVSRGNRHYTGLDRQSDPCGRRRNARLEDRVPKNGDAASQKRGWHRQRQTEIRHAHFGVEISGFSISAVIRAGFGRDTTHPKFCAYLELEFSTDLSEFSSTMTLWEI